MLSVMLRLTAFQWAQSFWIPRSHSETFLKRTLGPWYTYLLCLSIIGKVGSNPASGNGILGHRGNIKRHQWMPKSPIQTNQTGSQFYGLFSLVIKGTLSLQSIKFPVLRQLLSNPWRCRPKTKKLQFSSRGKRWLRKSLVCHHSLGTQGIPHFKSLGDHFNMCQHFP